MAKKKADVSTPSFAHGAMAPRWNLINALLGGTEAMRQAGEAYLPRYEKEKSKHYAARLERATLLNMLERTSDHLVGRALGKPPEPADDVPDQIVELLEDVDGLGTGFQTFARNAFKAGLDKGFTHVLVDHPAVEQREGRTLEDDRRDALRPYWVHVPAESVIFAHAVVENGREVLDHVRIREDEVEVSGWEEVLRRRIRVLRRQSLEAEGATRTVVTWELWEYEQEQGKKGEWKSIGSGTMDIDEIPLVTFYTQREGLCLSKPPLLDLAYLNVAHWQSSSDQRNVLTVSRFPMLGISGALAEDADGKLPIEVGPHSYLHMADPQGKFYYVEHNGAAIKSGHEDLEQLKEEMASYGAEFLKKRPANEGVVARALDSAESLSALQVWVIDFRDALERCLGLTAKWMKLGDGVDGGGSVELDHDDLGLDDVESEHLTALKDARAARDISRKTYLEELKRRRVLSPDFDAEEDAGELEGEAPSPELMGMGRDKDGNPLPPLEPPDPEEEDPPGGPPKE